MKLQVNVSTSAGTAGQSFDQEYNRFTARIRKLGYALDRGSSGVRPGASVEVFRPGVRLTNKFPGIKSHVQLNYSADIFSSPSKRKAPTCEIQWAVDFGGSAKNKRVERVVVKTSKGFTTVADSLEAFLKSER